MKILGPRLAVIIEEPKLKTDEGIFIPEMAQSDVFPTSIAKVVAVGTGYWQMGKLIETEIKVGDRVVIPKVVPKVQITEDGVTYAVIPDQEVVGIL